MGLQRLVHREYGRRANSTGDAGLLLSDYHDGMYTLAPVLAGWASARRNGACVDVRAFDESLPEQETKIAQFTDPSDMPQRVDLCEWALVQIDPEVNPETWASLLTELATSLGKNPQGDRARNLEQAIHLYLQALRVVSRQDNPKEWAAVQCSLGEAYCARSRGRRAKNVAQAIMQVQPPAALHP